MREERGGIFLLFLCEPLHPPSAPLRSTEAFGTHSKTHPMRSLLATLALIFAWPSLHLAVAAVPREPLEIGHDPQFDFDLHGWTRHGR